MGEDAVVARRCTEHNILRSSSTATVPPDTPSRRRNSSPAESPVPRKALLGRCNAKIRVRPVCTEKEEKEMQRAFRLRNETEFPLRLDVFYKRGSERLQNEVICVPEKVYCIRFKCDIFLGLDITQGWERYSISNPIMGQSFSVQVKPKGGSALFFNPSPGEFSVSLKFEDTGTVIEGKSSNHEGMDSQLSQSCN